MSLLIHSQPLLVLPELAERIGLNEAIVLQQIHYWQSRSANAREGRMWVYNSVEEWRKQFPFWSAKTISRTLASLRKQGILSTGQYNKQSRDQTLWYSINYGHSALNASGGPLGQSVPMEEDNMSTPLGQNDLMHYPKMGEPLPETTTETTTEKKDTDQRDALNEAFEIFWSAGMVKVGKAKARAKFEKLVRDGRHDPEEFARKLAIDVKARLSAGVFGFDRLHPITYLNGERWNDEIVGDLPDNVRSFHDRRPAPSSDDCGGRVCIPSPASDAGTWRGGQ